MSTTSWILFQLFFVVKRHRRKQNLAGIALVYMLCIIPVAATNERTAYISATTECTENNLDLDDHDADTKSIILTAESDSTPSPSQRQRCLQDTALKKTNDNERSIFCGLFSSAGNQQEVSGDVHTVCEFFYRPTTYISHPTIIINIIRNA